MRLVKGRAFGSPTSHTTERDGGAQWQPQSRGSVAEGGSAGCGELVDFMVACRLEPFGLLDAPLQISVLRPIKYVARKIVTEVRRAIDSALRKDHLPEALLFAQFRICLSHCRRSRFLCF